MALTAGNRLAEYEITAPIGAGGMGEVYRARDTKLGREVAIKVLPEAFSRDKDRLARFEREARLLASVNHPGIATLHGFFQSDGVRFLVMELVEGETLEARIERGAIPLDEAIPLFLQMSEAMEAAHDKGVIHRDLKPANVKITPDGRPKILDFGLAKGYATPESPASNVSESPTLTRGTSAGVILGTAPYMSPEQARAQSLDKRTDIWSFGCVLYEALTARRAFDGDTVADILGAIVKTEPDWGSIPDTTPRKVRELLSRCLEKDVRRRLRDMGEAWVALEDASAEEPTDVIEERRPKTATVMTLVAALATGLALLGLYLLTRPSAPPPRPVTITEISPPPGTELAWGDVAISPDGRLVAFPATRGKTTELYLRALDQVDAQPVDKGRGAVKPFFSPDGEWLGFYSLPEGLFNGKLMKVSVSGGAAVEIAEMDERPRGASWGPDDTIVLNAGFGRGLSRVSAHGGEAAVLASPDPQRFEKGYRFPELLPGGKAVLFTVRPSDTESMDDAPIAALSLETGEHRVVVEGGTYARYSSSGHLVYARDGALLAVAFDLAELRVTGTPVTVLEGVSMNSLGGQAVFSLSRDGTLLYAPSDAHGTSNRLVWVDRQGRSQPIVDGHEFLQAHISPDGGRLVAQTDGANFSLWVVDLRRLSMSRVAFGWDNGTPAWTPDGRQITFASNRGGGEFNLYQMAADGSAPAARLSPSDRSQIAPTWSPDGAVLAFVESFEDISLLSMDGERKPEPFLHTEFLEAYPRFSPDGRWISYESNESGQFEVYIRPFPRSEGKWPVSTSGGVEAHWNRNGKEIVYRAGDAMMAVDVVATESGITLGNPVKLFDWTRSYGHNWDVASDGERFVMVERGEQSPAPTRLRLIMNWSEELKRLVPAN